LPPFRPMRMANHTAPSRADSRLTEVEHRESGSG
jgi:hypothetical protein